MPDYPTFVLVTLEEINGNSCGSLQQRCEWDDGADPPQYIRTDEGDLPFCVVKRVTLSGGVITWDTTCSYLGAGSCYGFHMFRRTTADDDPTGNYCKRSGSGTNCNLGKLSVVNDD